MTTNAELDAQIVRIDRGFTLFSDLQADCAKDWLVTGLLSHGEASVVYGKPGDGKSVLVEDLGLHVAWGQPWHGRPVRRGAVSAHVAEGHGLEVRLRHRRPHNLLRSSPEFPELKLARILTTIRLAARASEIGPGGV